MAADSTTDEVATWQVITGSARGAAHRASGLPNQDAVSSQIVTGPSLLSVTSMWAPKTPVGTRLPSSRSSACTNAANPGAATSGGAAAL